MAELNGAPAEPAALETLALTNYGHFTTMLVTDGRVRGLALHLDRLVRDCRTVFDAELDREQVLFCVRRVLPAQGSLIVRVTVFDPALGLARIGEPARPQILVTTRPAAGPGLVPPLRVRSAAYVRDTPRVKSAGLFGALHRRREAVRAGYDDALFVDPTGAVLEGGTWNIGFVRADELVWPEGDSLPGVTVELLSRLRPFSIRRVPLAELASYDAAFATNAATGLRMVGEVDATRLRSAHPLVDELASAYQEFPGDPV